MPDIYDYMAWRGDLDISRDGFNEVDNLILSSFAYVPMQGIVPGDFGSGVTLAEAARRFGENKELWQRLRMRKDKRLFEELGACPRFARLRLHCHVDRVSRLEEKQFSAVTVELGDGSLFVAYRGTDNTLVGWKEDFNMSFMRQVPAQADAVAYLETVAAGFSGPLRVGGHSKGGNLAIYAAAFCSRPVQDRIIEVYTNDGPWLHADMARTPGYDAIRGRIRAFIPQTSIIGMLLEHEDCRTVVRSNQKGLFQHDFYSWQVTGTHFVRLAAVTGGSTFVDHTLKSWLAEWDEEQREIFVDALFRVINATGARTVQELRAKWHSNTLTMITSLAGLDKETRRAIGLTLKLLVKAAGRHLPSIVPALPLKKG